MTSKAARRAGKPHVTHTGDSNMLFNLIIVLILLVIFFRLGTTLFIGQEILDTLTQMF